MVSRRLVLVSSISALACAAAQQGGGAPKVRVEVYSDFQCPHCRILFENALDKLKRQYVQTGKIALAHRNYPLPGHPFAFQAAEYACAAERLGKYESVAGALFRRQEEWGLNGNIDATLLTVLSQAELEKVKKIAKEPAVKAEIERDVQAGRAVPITQTPTMVIYAKGNRYPVVGAVSYEVLDRAISSLLNK